MKMNGITLIIGLLVLILYAVSKTGENTECESQTTTVEGKPTWIKFTLPYNPVENPSYLHVMKGNGTDSEFLPVLDGIYDRTKKDFDFYPRKSYVFLGSLEDKTLVLFIPKVSLIHAGVYRVELETNTGDASNSPMGSCRLSVIPAGAAQEPDSAGDTVGKVAPVAVGTCSNTNCEVNLRIALIGIVVLAVSVFILGAGLLNSYWKGLAGKPKSKDEKGGNEQYDPSNQETPSIIDLATGEHDGIFFRNRRKGDRPPTKFCKRESGNEATADVHSARDCSEREPLNTVKPKQPDIGLTLKMASDPEPDTIISINGFPVNEN